MFMFASLEYLSSTGKKIYEVQGEERPYWEGCGITEIKHHNFELLNENNKIKCTNQV